MAEGGGAPDLIVYHEFRLGGIPEARAAAGGMKGSMDSLAMAGMAVTAVTTGITMAAKKLAGELINLQRSDEARALTMMTVTKNIAQAEKMKA